jgi:hypothetical protein
MPRCSTAFDQHGPRVEVVDGDVEEALDLGRVHVDRHDAVAPTLVTSVLATTLALIGTRPSSLRSLRA